METTIKDCHNGHSARMRFVDMNTEATFVKAAVAAKYYNVTVTSGESVIKLTISKEDIKRLAKAS